MSRIGKLPVAVPAQVKVAITANHLKVEGPKGKLQLDLPLRTKAVLENNQIVVTRDSDDSEAKALHGLSRALIANMIKGVTDGFVKKLEINGVGFKAALQGKILNLTLGYSHPINYPIPDQIKVTIEANTKITIEGPDKQVVGRVAAEIRAYYPPEPYKGKGVKYDYEKIERKEGKTVQ